MLLSDKTIKQAKPESRPYKLSDGEGLYMLIQPSGSKLWRMKYYFAGKENVLSIGKYPIISLAEARDQRYNTKKLLQDSIDPNGKKRDEKYAALLATSNSFYAIAQDWHRINNKKMTPDHAEKIWRRLELHAMQTIGSRPIAAIKTPELVPLLRRLEKQDKSDTAKRLAQSFNAIFRFALHSGLIEHNPASDLQGVIVPHRSQHYAAVHPSELPELLRRLRCVSTTEQNRLAVKMLLHTFVRPGELRYGKWEEIDWQQMQWLIPAERMKKRRPHRVPLSEPVLLLLQELKSISGYNAFLFPSQQRQRHPVMSENTINKILKTMGYGGRQVGHGFRAIASTVLNESALFRPDVIEAQLAHIENNNSRRPYNRAEYIEERVAMMAWWSDYLQVAENKTTSSAKQDT